MSHLLDFLKRKYNDRNFQKVFTLLSILITVGVLALLIFRNWDDIKYYVLQFRWKNLLFSFGIYSVCLAITVLVWARIMDNLGHKVPFGQHFRAFCISALGKRLPGTLWYIAWRTMMYQEAGFSGKLLLLTSSIEQIAIVFSALIVSTFFSIPIIIKFPYSIIAYVVILAISLLMLHPNISRYFFNRLNVDYSKFKLKDMLKWTLAYLPVWLLVGLMLYSNANVFADVPIKHLFYFIGVCAINGVLSRIFLVLPSNFGFSEISTSLLLAGIVTPGLAIVVGIATRIFTILFEIIWAVISLSISSHSQQNNS